MSTLLKTNYPVLINEFGIVLFTLTATLKCMGTKWVISLEARHTKFWDKMYLCGVIHSSTLYRFIILGSTLNRSETNTKPQNLSDHKKKKTQKFDSVF